MKSKVLAVDDRPENLFAMKQLLRREEIELYTESSGEQALSLIREHDFSCILLDVQMPDIDGYDLAKMIRTNPEEKGTPIIFITANNHDETQLKNGYDSGAVDYVFKPVDPVIIKSKIRFFAELHEQKQLVLEQSRQLQEQMEERDRLEKHLRQSGKMEALGTLAGGVAHEFNNLLSIMLGLAEVTRNEVPKKSSIENNLNGILNAGHRASSLVQQILMFSRETEVEKKTIQMIPLLKEAVKLIRSTTPTTVEIHQEIDISEATVLADPTFIHQIVMNLCVNANHSMRKKGGLLTIRLTDAKIDKDFARVHEFTGEKYLQLTVQDTGCGIPQDIMDQIFDPFFTTKGVGEGTGLGLSVVHGFVKNHGGAIAVQSVVGEGTSFHVYLPTVSEPLKADSVHDLPIRHGDGSILVVDDEEVLLTVQQQILEGLGYTVTATTNSEEALEIFRKEPEKFDVVLTDQTMPKMTGVQLAEKLLKIRPGIPIILATGFSETTTSEQAEELGLRDYLMKPIDIPKLAASLHRILSEN